MGAASGLRERKKVQTRNLLSEAALDLFSSQGFEATTVDEIAAAADVSRRTFFRYFATKEAVVAAGRGTQLDQLRRRLSVRSADECAYGAVRRVCLEQAAEFMRRRAEVVALQHLIDASPTLIAQDLAHDLEWEGAVAEALGDRVGASTPERRQARVRAGAVVGVIRATLREWIAGEGRADLVEMGREAFDLLERDGGFSREP